MWIPYQYEQDKWAYKYIRSGSDDFGFCADPPAPPNIQNGVYIISSWNPQCDSCGNVTGQHDP